MFFIGGIYTDRKEISYYWTMLCRSCGEYTNFSFFMTCNVFSFFFIPLFRWGKHYYATAQCCGAVYELPKEIGQALERGDESVRLREEDFTLVSCGHHGKRCPNCGFATESNFDYCPKCGHKLQ